MYILDMNIKKKLLIYLKNEFLIKHTFFCIKKFSFTATYFI